MIALFTDFGLRGPYVGQMKAALLREAPGVPLVDLMHDAPAFDPRASAYLLAALVDEFPAGTVFAGVVDPGVGSAARRPVMLRAGGRWFVGPDNGLFAIVARRAGDGEWREILWRPERLSASFHGRDLFAPVAARLARGEAVEEGAVAAPVGADWSDDLPEVIYVDDFGNAVTGLRASVVDSRAGLVIDGRRLPRARTFADVPVGQAFCYENSSGLLEIAVNQGSAAETLGLRVGAGLGLD